MIALQPAACHTSKAIFDNAYSQLDIPYLPLHYPRYSNTQGTSAHLCGVPPVAYWRSPGTCLYFRGLHSAYRIPKAFPYRAAVSYTLALITFGFGRTVLHIWCLDHLLLTFLFLFTLGYCIRRAYFSRYHVVGLSVLRRRDNGRYFGSDTMHTLWATTLDHDFFIWFVLYCYDSVSQGVESSSPFT
jgi:hypothetical protein